MQGDPQISISSLALSWTGRRHRKRPSAPISWKRKLPRGVFAEAPTFLGSWAPPRGSGARRWDKLAALNVGHLAHKSAKAVREALRFFWPCRCMCASTSQGGPRGFETLTPSSIAAN